MEIGATIIQRLQDLKESERQCTFDFMPASTTPPYVLTIDAQGCEIGVVVDELDKDRLRLSSYRVCGPVVPMKTIPQSFRNLVERITNKIELPYGPIEYIEKDESNAHAVLRTAPTERSRFYEIVIAGGNRVELRHYSVNPKSKERKLTAAPVDFRSFTMVADTMLVEVLDVLCQPS